MENVTKIVNDIRALTIVEFIELCDRLDISRSELMNGLSEPANVGVYKAVCTDPEFSKKIQAIKIVRDHAKLPLKESKDFIDGTMTLKLDFEVVRKINADLDACLTYYRINGV